jgi:large subunit ribosomal protein L3
MGSDKVTVKNLKVIKIDKENNIILVKGAIPGSKNSIVYLSK